MPGEDPSRSKRSDAAERGYWSEQIAKTDKEKAITVAGIEVAGNLAGKGLDLLTEVIRAGVSNPVLGAVGAIIVADILRKAGIIDPGAQTLTNYVVGALVTTEIVVDVSQGVAEVISALEGKSVPTNAPPLQPSAQVVVFGAAAPSGITRALAGQIVPEVKYLEGKG